MHRPEVASTESPLRAGQPTAWYLVVMMALLAASLAAFVRNTSSLPLYTKGESREAVQVAEVVREGRWVLPLRNGEEIPAKPPLFHWLAAVAATVHGRLDELAVRAPSIVFGALVVLGVVATGTRQWGLAAGLMAGLVLATSFEWLRAARSARVDMVLAACLTSAFLSLGAALGGRRASPALLAWLYASMALGCLAKGPVAIVLPALVALAYLALRRDLGSLRRLHPVAGCALAVAVPALWYVAAAAIGGQAFVDRQVLHENVYRFLGAEAMARSHAHSVLYYVPGFVAGFLPWSLFLPPLVAWLIRERRRLDEDGRLFLLVWAVTVFGFFSIPSSKRTVYLLPAYPAVALLLGRWWRDLLAGATEFPRGCVRLLRGLAVGAAVGVGVLTCGALGGLTFGAMPAAPYATRPELSGLLVGLRDHGALALGIAGLVLGAGLLVGRELERSRWHAATCAAVVMTVATSFFGIEIVEPGVAAGVTMKPFMERVRQRVPPSEPLYFLGGEPEYSLVFYAERHVKRLRLREVDTIAALEPDAFVLMFEDRWRKLDAAKRERFTILDRSVEIRDPDWGRVLLAGLRPLDATARRSEKPDS